MKNLVLYRDWGFSPSSAEAWPLECLCILVLTLLRATAPNEKSCQLLPNLELDDSSRVGQMSYPCASRGSLLVYAFVIAVQWLIVINLLYMFSLCEGNTGLLLYKSLRVIIRTLNCLG